MAINIDNYNIHYIFTIIILNNSMQINKNKIKCSELIKY